MKSEMILYSGSVPARIHRERYVDRFVLEALEPRRLLNGTSATATLDPTFGNAGYATPLPSSMTGSATTYTNLTPAGDGKFYAVTFDEPDAATGFNWNLLDSAFELMRINSDGSLDQSFGTDGGVRITRYDPTDTYYPWMSGAYHSDYDALSVGGLFVQPDGKVLLAVRAVPHGPPDPWLLMRFNTDGTPDTGFGDGGTVTLPITQDWEMPTAWFQPDGKIDLIGADAYRNPGDPETAEIQQFNTDGSPDASFGVDGASSVSFTPDTSYASRLPDAVDYETNVAGAAALPGGGSIVYLSDSTWSNTTQQSAAGLIAMSFDADGNLVASPTIYSTGPQSNIYYLNNTVVQPDGKAVVIDSASDRLLRFNTDGSADAAFDAGAANEPIPTGFNISNALVQPDGKIVVVASDSSNTLQGLQRLNADGSVDTTFAGGQMTFGFGDHESIGAVTTLGDDSLIVSINDRGGWYYGYDESDTQGPQLVHLLPGGGTPGTFDDQSAEDTIATANDPTQTLPVSDPTAPIVVDPIVTVPRIGDDPIDSGSDNGSGDNGSGKDFSTEPTAATSAWIATADTNAFFTPNANSTTWNYDV